jgi:hypothetical protein
MEEKRGMDKKGQQVSVAGLILIVIGVVVLIVLIIGFTQGFDFFFGKIDVLPGQELEAVAQSCKVAHKGKLRIDYCSFKEVEVDGEKEFVNCLDTRVDNAIKGDLEGDRIKCGESYSGLEYCNGKDSDVKVNGDTCAEWAQK